MSLIGTLAEVYIAGEVIKRTKKLSGLGIKK